MQDNQDNKEQNAAEKPAEAANEPKMDMKSDTPAPDPKPPAGTKDPGESQKMNDAGGDGPSAPKAKKDQRPLIIALLVIIILALIVAAILLWFNNQSDNNGTSSSSSSTSSSSSSESSSSSASSSDVTESISITSPSDGGSVNGDVTVEGTATATLDELTIQIHDDNGLMLGSGVVDLSSGEIWSVSVAISKSPGTLAGTIKVFPTTEGETSTLAQMVNVNFDTQEVADRLKLYAPLSNQLMSDTKILFRGEMQDFFEGTFSIRLKDESGAVIFTDSIMADGENYGQFATFEKLVDVGTIPAAAGSTGTWEIYEVSAMDGSTIILLSVPVRFVE